MCLFQEVKLSLKKNLWKNYELGIPISFSFNIAGFTKDSIDISDVGAVSFNTITPANSFFILFFGFGASFGISSTCQKSAHQHSG